MYNNEFYRNRLNKLEIIEGKTPAYAGRFETNHTLEEASLLEDGTGHVRVAGRITFMRKMGKMSFLLLEDLFGKCQVALRKDVVGEENYDLFKKGIDIGDFIGVEGEVFTTKTGEKTIRVSQFEFLSKALLPLPEKFHGISNVESCYRQRYLDLIMNDSTKDRFIKKFQFTKEIRRYLEDHTYVEIETPVLIDHPSGATAKPFASHHNALDMPVFMRIAPETYLKRAIVGGFTKVFEVARCFRNEGIDTSHLQDFTMIEGYCAYYDYKDNMVFLKDMLCHVIEKVFGNTTMEVAGHPIDFSGHWPVVTFRDLLIKDCSIDIEAYPTEVELLATIEEKEIYLESDVALENLGKGNLIDLLYKKVSRPKIISPTFLTEHPTVLSPLARSNDDNPEVVDRFQLIINGAEVINAYSELVDPVEQRKRLVQQAAFKAGGDDEAMMMDEEYIQAMSYGMPPISGWGMGVDRILQVLLDQDNIKDLILFPLMRPQ